MDFKVAVLAIALLPFAEDAPGGRQSEAAASRRTPKTAEVLPFIEDDYRGAMAQARTKKLPIFVETWAPW